jgi:hypothetical protein
MNDARENPGDYPHFTTTRLSDGLAEAVKAVRLKLDVNRSVAMRRMLTIGAREILGPDWKPTSKH